MSSHCASRPPPRATCPNLELHSQAGGVREAVASGGSHRRKHSRACVRRESGGGSAAGLLGRRTGGLRALLSQFLHVSRPGRHLSGRPFRGACASRKRNRQSAARAGWRRLPLERGYGRLEWAVLDWNTPSIEFYRSLGAVALDEWTGYRLTGEALDRLAGRSSADREAAASSRRLASWYVNTMR